MRNLRKGSIDPKLLALLAVVVAAFIYYIYSTDFKAQSSSSFSATGYVVYESPAEYNFLIISATSTPVSGTLPDMTGFPSATDPGYQYISDAGYKGTFPSLGDKVSVHGDVDTTVETNPPYTFADTATSIDVLASAQFNATVQGPIQAIQ